MKEQGSREGQRVTAGGSMEGIIRLRDSGTASGPVKSGTRKNAEHNR